MAVAFDAKATAYAATTGTGVTTLSNNNLTVGSGSNRALIAVVTWVNTATPTSPSANWDTAGTNQAMTQIGSTIANGSDVHCALFGLVAPTSGAKNFTITWTNACGCYVDLIAFTGVDQTSVAVAFPHFNSATGSTSPASVTITSATGNYTVADFGATPAADLTTLNQTNLYGPAADDVNGTGGGNYAVGAASNTHTCTTVPTSGAVWVAIGTDVLASGGAAAAPFYKSDWAVQKDIVGIPPQAAQTNINLYTNPIPFKQTEWSRQRFTLPRAPDASQPTNLNLFKNPIPFNQKDTSGSRQLQDWLVPPQPYNLALYTVTVAVSPFKQTDWQSPKMLPDLPAPLQPYNLALYTITVAAAPFQQTNWPIPKLPSPSVAFAPPNTLVNLLAQPLIGPDLSTSKFQQPRAPDATQQTNINLFTNPIPFDQTDWPVVKKPLPAPPQAVPYNAAIYTVQIVQAPFNQTDWSTTKFQRPRAPDASQSTSINLLPDPTQFMLVDWSGSVSSLRPRAPDLPAYNQSLYTITVAAAPFSQTDWPKSQPLKSATSQIYPNIALLNPVIVAAPFVPIDWQIQRRLQPQAPWSSPNIPLLDLLSKPFANIDWSVSHRLPSAPISGSVGFQILTNSINTDLAVTEASDTLVAAGTLAIAASASLVEANDTLVATAALAIAASSALTEDADTLSATGVNGGINADLSVTEANDTLSAAGTVSGVVESGGGYKYGWKPWRPSRKKRIEEELEELEEFLKAAAEAAPKVISKPPVVYHGPLSAIFYEPIEPRVTPTVNEIMARAKAKADAMDDEEEAILLLFY